MTQRERILVVDDDEAGRYLKARLLTKAGYPVLEAASGKAARDFCAANAFALILLDVKLPDANGVDLCREFKAAWPHTLIMQTSAAFTSQQNRASGLAGGADAYLVEPLDAEEFLATVESLLRRYRTEHQLREKQANTEEQLRHAQKLDVLGQLTGGIAHDFNNVLTIVMGNLESMRRQLAKESPDLVRIRTNTDSAFYGAQRAIGITRQLLAFSRRQPLAPRVLDINAVIRNLGQLLRQVLGEKIGVGMELAETLWPVLCDADQLETVILNLVVNARDAMAEGGTLVIRTDNHHTGNGHAEGRDCVLLSVADSGSGMSPDVLKYAFEPFFTTKDVGHGTGLGLSQVHGFVRQSGGSVEIDSEIGKGTAVKLSFPRYTGDVPASGPTHNTALPHTAQSRKMVILVVEDDALVRQHTIGILNEMGHTVLESSTGPQALNMIQSNPQIELVFTDVGLAGGFSGAEVGRRARVLRPDLKILYTTGYANERLTREGMGEDEMVLVKPFTFEGLAEKLGEVLSAKAHSKIILMIEDEPLIRLDMASNLRDVGYEVIEAGSVAEALAQVKEHGDQLGAIMSDIGLPDGRGDDLVLKLRTQYAGLPVLITTGYEDPALKAKFRNDPATTFLSKPYFVEEVVDALQRMGVMGTLPRPPLHPAAQHPQ